MPLYEYEVIPPKGEENASLESLCKICRGRFALNRPIDAPELEDCPLCHKPVRKIISLFNTPHYTKPVSISDAKKAGFTVLKRTSKGEYERQ
jgi:hypothetical protein